MDTDRDQAEQNLALAVYTLEQLTSTQEVITQLEELIDVLLDKQLTQ